MDLKNLDKGVFLVNVQAILCNPITKKILMGRRENDPYIEKLTWSFPGGKANYEADLEECLKEQVKKKTGLEIKIEKIIFAKTYPEDRKIISIYYLCEPAGGKEKVDEKFVELKWIKPTEVKNYFTTSLHRKLVYFLKSLE